MKTETIRAADRLCGEISVPGDKSISHRSIMLGALGEGATRISGFLQGEDNYSTLNAFRAMGVEIEDQGGGNLLVTGVGLHGLVEPTTVLDCGNSGTTMRLMTGLLSGQKFFSVLTGDQYLRKRPMRRVVEPLSLMGAKIDGRDGGERAPLAIRGGNLHGIEYASPVASAQIKSALLLAGLYAKGETTVREPHLSRDHSERMLKAFGADLTPFEGGVTLTPGSRLLGRDVVVPGDISSAAFFLVAGLIAPQSELLIRNVGINPTRSGILDILLAMGGDIQRVDEREVCGEPVADLLVKSSQLHGIEIGGSVVPRAIDELPVIAVAAAVAEGRTTIRDAGELRVKETDRIDAMVCALTLLGGQVEGREDGMVIDGVESLSGGSVLSRGDHRIAMSLAVAAHRATAEVTITDTDCTETSFPGFWPLLRSVQRR
ncbi:MAG: 3-phosphoshikimate 1-carboxyvinyltransferase [Desulfuromonadales bacterium]|nr:3-phosphoshikimate 1-carboxyvinyltransferase [Desulfuromonadales bacterium]